MEPEKAVEENKSEIQPQPIRVPTHVVFMPGETFPMKGWFWKVKGWTTSFEVVLECVGMTGKATKKARDK